MDAPHTRFQEIMYEKTRHSWPTARGLMHLVVCARIDGAIDTETFELAARCLGARYPILCSRLVMKKFHYIRQRIPPIEFKSAPPVHIITKTFFSA